MAVFIDDQAVNLNGAHLGQVIDEAKNLMAGRRRIIVEVQCDGRVLLGDDLEKSRPQPVAEAEVRMISAAPRDLAVEALSQVRQRLNAARAAQQEAADLLQRDRAKEAVREIGKAIAIWQQTQQAIRSSTQLIGIHLDGREFEGKPVTDVPDQLAARLISLRDLMAAGDSVGLADSLQYEWSEGVDQWQRLVDQILLWIDEAET